MHPGHHIILHLLQLREAKEDLTDGIYIRFRTDGSLFNLRRLLARTNITELLFADDCALLVQTKEALQHIVNLFSDAAKNLGLTISLKKTEVSYQLPPREVYNPPQISIDDTNLNEVEPVSYTHLTLPTRRTV